MNDRRTRLILFALVAAQALLLLGLTLLHGARIADGTEVRIAVQPVDPTDLARGSYVALDYDFENLEDSGLSVAEGDDVVMELHETGREGVYEPTGRYVTDSAKLDDGTLYLTLPVNGDGTVSTESIGTWYASSDEAQRAERELAGGKAVAVLSLDRDGHPTLERVEAR